MTLAQIVTRIRRNPAARRLARAAVRAIPNRPHTRRFEGFGPFRFRLRSQRWMLWESPVEGEGYMVGVLARLVRPGDVCYDVGANIGVFTRVMVSWLGASRVLAFEPMSANLEILRENVRLGGMEDRVAVFPLALGDADAEELLQIDDVSSGTAVLDRISGGQASEGRKHLGLPPRTERVSVRRLDALIVQHALPPPTMMKIDTEGAEVMVLRGAERTLRDHRPRLHVALHGEDKARGTIEFLASLGYAVFGPVRTPTGTEHRRLAPGDASILGNNNIIASMDEADVREPIAPMTRAPAARVGGSAG